MKRELTYLDLPGLAIRNPNGEERPAWVLNVIAVSSPPEDGLITISAVEGEIVTNHDMLWDQLLYSEWDRVFEEALLMDECERLGIKGGDQDA